ncbi:hypothetical protein B0T21DRAFT_345622 [Apiosordaria backusii]|uniref:Uncharacterized protein n=1 Tax=Apiosordaria backusii TaxID=314023 RepID=A0AA40K0R8_9PEZI|nr:hypothetical protein B0T21DRAFT_345622 [Apiosordaria backusii]
MEPSEQNKRKLPYRENADKELPEPSSQSKRPRTMTTEDTSLRRPVDTGNCRLERPTTGLSADHQSQIGRQGGIGSGERNWIQAEEEVVGLHNKTGGMMEGSANADVPVTGDSEQQKMEFIRYRDGNTISRPPPQLLSTNQPQCGHPVSTPTLLSGSAPKTSEIDVANMSEAEANDGSCSGHLSFWTRPRTVGGRFHRLSFYQKPPGSARREYVVGEENASFRLDAGDLNFNIWSSKPLTKSDEP